MEFGPVLENVASVFALLITLSVIVERGLATVSVGSIIKNY